MQASYMPSAMHKPLAWLLGSALPKLALLTAASLAQAQTSADLQTQALQWARQAAPGHLPSASPPLRLDVSVGDIDNRLRLAPCGHVEPFLPAGSRLWGRTRVGLRCVDGITRWSITVPVTVRVSGPAWVVRNPLPTGATLGPGDAVQADVDWTEESAPVLAEPSQWIGQSATRPLATGQVLRQGAVRPAQVFGAGSHVRVVARGKGFQVASEGQALSAGVVGQGARVRMDNGRIASGTVLDARTVQIDL